MSNFMWNLLNAIATNQSSEGQQQLADSQTTNVLSTLLTTVYTAAQQQLATDSSLISQNSGNSAQLQVYTTQYQEDQTKYSNWENQDDGYVQGATTQTQQDASNQQNIVAFASSVLQVASTLAQLLAKTY